MHNILNSIGNTPLVKLQKINPNPKVAICAKLEGFNPSGSVKDRIVLKMIEDAERGGRLKKGMTIVEPTSGNTGISVAMIGAVKGYRVIIVMPEHVSPERRKIIKSFGAELILCKPEEWRGAAIEFTKKMVSENKNYMMLNQFENEMNIMAHYEHTAEEILNQMEGRKIDVFLAGIGTGGTLIGIAKKLKKIFPDIKIIGVEPNPGSKIEGLKSTKEGYVPPIIDFKLVDEIFLIEDEDAFRTSRDLAKYEGIFAGISSGAACFAALQAAKKIKEGNIVTVFADRGEKYLSTKLFNI